MNVFQLIAELSEIQNKDMEVAIRSGVVITDVDFVFECESDGVPFICIDGVSIKSD